MAQIRMISRNLGSSRKFHAVNARCGKLGHFAQTLAPLIVVNADRFGRLEGDAFTVKHKVFPVSPRTEEDFETVLQAMSAVGLIRFYEVVGNRYLEVVNIDREQRGSIRGRGPAIRIPRWRRNETVLYPPDREQPNEARESRYPASFARPFLPDRMEGSADHGCHSSRMPEPDTNQSCCRWARKDRER